MRRGRWCRSPWHGDVCRDGQAGAVAMAAAGSSGLIGGSPMKKPRTWRSASLVMFNQSQSGSCKRSCSLAAGGGAGEEDALQCQAAEDGGDVAGAEVGRDGAEAGGGGALAVGVHEVAGGACGGSGGEATAEVGETSGIGGSIYGGRVQVGQENIPQDGTSLNRAMTPRVSCEGRVASRKALYRMWISFMGGERTVRPSRDRPDIRQAVCRPICARLLQQLSCGRSGTQGSCENHASRNSLF